MTCSCPTGVIWSFALQWPFWILGVSGGHVPEIRGVLEYILGVVGLSARVLHSTAGDAELGLLHCES